MGGVSIAVVNSSGSTITDEPANHASPINQTEYFYDSKLKQWMVAYPQGKDTGGSGAPAVADTSKTTMAGLIMLPSGKRFDTTIIPLNTKQFLVISDGGGVHLRINLQVLLRKLAQLLVLWVKHLPYRMSLMHTI